MNSRRGGATVREAEINVGCFGQHAAIRTFAVGLILSENIVPSTDTSVACRTCCGTEKTELTAVRVVTGICG